MTWLTESTDITARFEAQSTVPVKSWEAFNIGSAEPEKPVFRPPPIDYSDVEASIWARLQVVDVPGAVPPIEGASTVGPLGLGTYAPNYREGLILVSIFVPRAVSEETLSTYVQETITIFHRASFGTVSCRDALPPSRVGYSDDGNWYQVNVTIPFYVVEVLVAAP